MWKIPSSTRWRSTVDDIYPVLPIIRNVPCVPEFIKVRNAGFIPSTVGLRA